MAIPRRTLQNVALILVLVGGLMLRPASAAPQGEQTDIVGPAGSGSFGYSVTALPNGNIVVTDPDYDAGVIADVGAVYLYDGADGALISTLTGSSTDDQVGSGGVGVLSNGNYIVRSPHWDNVGAVDAGAVTWGDGTTGVSGVVSSANSLVGSTGNDSIGAVNHLSNGNYVVRSPYWDNGTVADAGAVTWGNGTTGTTGVVSSTNSLVGSATGDGVGMLVTALSNGNYVVASPYWHNGDKANAGAVTWGDGATGITAVVSSTNSLVGSTRGDRVGWLVTELTNGNYVVGSPYWHNGGAADAGAATWGDGTVGTSGVVSSTNSLVGSVASDKVCAGVAALSNGNYVVRSPYWHNGSAAYVGAATWGDGTSGVTGVVSSTNSLVGSATGDQVGYGVAVLSNGNYVVLSPEWHHDSTVDAGAATWADGTSGISGIVSSTNSLVGSAAGDNVGYGVTALTNGNYVVRSPYWHNGSAESGAVTWGDGTTGTTGVVSSTNSLIGSSGGDRVGWLVTPLSNGNYVVSSEYWKSGTVADAGVATWGNGTTGTTGVVSSANSLVGSATDDEVGYRVTALANGNYVVASPTWDSGGTANVGAVTWGNGTTGTSGVVSPANSLVGTAAGDGVGSEGVEALSNGNYLVSSPEWNGGAGDTGAVTWGDGATGISGAVSSANSLVGSTSYDVVGSSGATGLSDGHYVVQSPHWDRGATADAGAVTWGCGTTGVHGTVTDANSVRGMAAGGGLSMTYDYDTGHGQLVVGRPDDNIVTLFRPRHQVYLPLVLR
jgi:hypothetical protein